MAIITGTEGDDLIFGNNTNDTIDGKAGFDTVDYSQYNSGIRFSPLSGGILGTTRSIMSPTLKFDALVNIERVVGNPNTVNTITLGSLSPSSTSSGVVDVDLSTNQVNFTTADGIARSYSISNFNNFNNGPDPFTSGNIFLDSRFVGNDRDNNILLGGSTNIVIASKGNDTIDCITSNGAVSKSTIDYSNIGTAIKYSLDPAPISSTNSTIRGTIDKGNNERDKVSNIGSIIGAIGQRNTIDWSATTDGYNVNLATNSLQDPQSIINFVDAVGGKGNDTIVGGNKNSKLTGGGGNDTITGGTKNDRITGTDSTARGVGEVDTLTGGSGRDKFVLGDRNGAYYLGNGSNDYATITDFNLTRDSIDLGGFKDYSFGFDGANTIDLFAGKDVNTRDLIAKIQLADLGLTAASKDVSSARNPIGNVLVSPAGMGIDAISSQLNILANDTSTADAIV